MYGNKKEPQGDEQMKNKDLEFNIHVEIPFNVANCTDNFDKWVKRLADIQKEYSCHCTLSVKVN